MAPPIPVINAIPGDQKISVSWPAVAGATSYNVYYDDDAVHPPHDPSVVAGEGAPPINVTSPGIVLTGLPNGVTHYIQVTSVNGGESGFSNEEIVVPNPPATISVLRACVDLPKNFRVDTLQLVPVPLVRLKWDVVTLTDWTGTHLKTLSPVDIVPLSPGLSNVHNCKSFHAAQTLGYRLYRDDFGTEPFEPTTENLIVDESVLTALVEQFDDLSTIPGTDYRYFIEVVGSVP